MSKTIIINDNDQILDKQGQLLIDLSQYNASREELYRLRRTIDDLNRAPPAYQKWADMAEMLSKWRLFPRAFFAVYMIVFLHIINWAMGLEAMTTQQVTLVGSIVGLATAIFGIYCGTGGNEEMIAVDLTIIVISVMAGMIGYCLGKLSK